MKGTQSIMSQSLGDLNTLFGGPDYPQFQANPFYDYEDVIDSDEELDLESIVS